MTNDRQKLALGTVQFGLDYGISNMNGKASKAEIKRILSLCRAQKIELVDTASAYGDAERLLGETNVEGFRVVSKFLSNDSPRSFFNQLSSSLENLQLRSLYGYLAHQPDKLLEKRWEWEALQEARSSGKVEKIGYSVNEPSQLEKLLDRDLIPDLVQVPYNYLDRRFEVWIAALKKRSIEIHTRSTFLQGLLFCNPASLSSYFAEIKPFLMELRKQNNLVGALLRFVLSNDSIDHVVLGVDSFHHLEGNLNSIHRASWPLPPAPELSEKILMPLHWPRE